MRYKLLGKSGLRVSELCLGAMVLGGDGGATREESGRILDAFSEAGGNFIDTADAYSQGTSERYVGEWLGARRDEFVVATKYTLSRKASQIKENLGALEVELSEDQRARLDEASAIELGFPHDFINRVRQSEFVLGEARDRIDSHRSERSGLPLPG